MRLLFQGFSASPFPAILCEGRDSLYQPLQKQWLVSCRRCNSDRQGAHNYLSLQENKFVYVKITVGNLFSFAIVVVLLCNSIPEIDKTQKTLLKIRYVFHVIERMPNRGRMTPLKG